MGGYSYDKKFQVLYSDCDERDEIKPSALLSYGQEVAGLSADELGFGYRDTIADGCGFFVVTTCCELYAPARVKDLLTVSTWPLPPRRVFFERDYTVQNEEGTRIASIASRWCLIELESGKLLTADRLKAHATCPYRDEQVLTPDWSLPKLAGEGERVYSLTARPSNLDHFRHVNNTKYADFFTDCFSQKELDKKRISSFRISYVKQVKEGETMEFFRKDFQGGTALETRVNGEPTTRFFVSFQERERV